MAGVQSDVAVTGAASGLGRVLVESLLERGRRVVLLDRDQEQLHATAAELSGRFAVPVPLVTADLSTLAGVDRAADQLLSRFHVAALVNNAGGWLPGEQCPGADPDRWLAALTLNLIAPMRLTARLWLTLSAASGAVVNVGSSGGEGDDAYGSPEYGAAKAGVRRFTASLASRPDVRIMAVVPGWIGLARAHRQWAALSAEEQHAVGPLIPPRAVADAVLDLLDHGRPGQIVDLMHDPDRR